MNTPRTVLMIDDDIDDHEIFREVLYAIEPMITCLHPLSAELALDILLLDGQRPDIVFLDVNMPVMNGFDFLEEMMKHEELRSIPVTMYTTSSHKAQKERAKMLGAVDFITKPSDMGSLKAVLEAVLLFDNSH